MTEVFIEQDLQCGEGPVWDSQSKQLYWVESGGTGAYHAGETDRTAALILRDRHAASLVLHSDGGILFCGKDGFTHLTAEGNYRSLADSVNGIPVVNINDIIADGQGRVLGGQDCFREDAAYETGYLFQIDNNGDIHILEEGLHLSNGMGFSPANDKFYLTDTITRNIYVYDYQLSSGKLSNKKILITLDKNEGLPDGLTVDREGFIWVARWFGNGISRFDPEGKLQCRINIPVAQASSLTFGGNDYNHIYITTAGVHWNSPLAPTGHDFTTPRGGSVYRVIQDIQGKEDYKATV